MIIKSKLNIGSKKSPKIIYFGEVNADSEIDQAYQLRYQVYSQKGYINPDKYPDKREFDNYDIDNKCKYFIATHENRVIGFIRIIRDAILPTEKYFLFDEPEDMQKIPRDKRCELGRFVIIPPNKDEYFPRGLVMLFLLDCLIGFATENNIGGGYSFIKKSLEKKLRDRKMPIHELTDYTPAFDMNATLYLYFTQLHDPVIPIYFLTEEYKDYIQKKIYNSFLFTKEGGGSFSFKRNPFIWILKLFKFL